jgi:hypothetical protein
MTYPFNPPGGPQPGGCKPVQASDITARDELGGKKGERRGRVGGVGKKILTK